jgi:hypothetical protein
MNRLAKEFAGDMLFMVAGIALAYTIKLFM